MLKLQSLIKERTGDNLVRSMALPDISAIALIDVDFILHVQ